VLGLAASRHRLLAVAAAGVATVLAARRLTGTVDQPFRLAARLVGRGTIRAPAPIVAGLARAWGPALVVALASRRLRRGAAALLVAPALVEWVRTRPRMDPARYVVAHVVDDVAYGAGVWAGCLRARTARPLLPHVTLRSARWPGDRRPGASVRPEPDHAADVPPGP